MCRLVNRKKTWRLNPFKAAVPLWGQTTYNWTGLSPKRDCGSKRVKRGFGRTQKDRSPRTGRVAFFVAGGSNWLLLLPTTCCYSKCRCHWHCSRCEREKALLRTDWLLLLWHSTHDHKHEQGTTYIYDYLLLYVCVAVSLEKSRRERIDIYFCELIHSAKREVEAEQQKKTPCSNNTKNIDHPLASTHRDPSLAHSMHHARGSDHQRGTR